MTAAKVRAILRKAGHQCAKAHTTRIRGWHSWSPGFLVRETGNAITVQYRADHPTKEREDARIAEYAAALDQAGVTVTRDNYGHLIVARPGPVQ